MGSIFLENFPCQMTGYRGRSEKDDRELIVFVGHDEKNKVKELLENALEKLFTSLILHDQIFMGVGEILSVIESIGLEDALILMQSGVIKVVGINGGPCVMQVRGSPCKTVGFVGGEPNSVEFIAEGARKSFPLCSAKSISQLEFLIGDSTVELDSRSLRGKIISELEFDFSNIKLRADLGIKSERPDDLDVNDIPMAARIASILFSLAMQDSLKVDAVALDGFSMPYLNKKFSSFGPKANVTTEPFEKILNMKGIPGIYGLYKNKILSMRDILEIRDSCNGRVFRHWYESTDYNEDEAFRTILNRPSESFKSRFARFVYPAVTGVFSTAGGVAAAAIDSFLVSRIIEGWRPSLFLDDVLKNSIDMRVAEAEASRARSEIQERFGNIGRNDLCPCGSERKFKKCHGKDL